MWGEQKESIAAQAAVLMGESGATLESVLAALKVSGVKAKHALKAVYLATLNTGKTVDWKTGVIS